MEFLVSCELGEATNSKPDCQIVHDFGFVRL